MAPSLDYARMANKLFLVIFFVYLAGFFAHAAYLKKTVYGDGIYYFSWLRSIVVDHDVQFTDEYTYFHASQPKTWLGVPGNKYTIGPAILWSPFYLWTYAIVHKTGFELPYQLAAGLSSVLYAIAALAFLYILLDDRFGKIVSIASIICIAFASNLFFYGSLDAVNSHAVSFFAATIFLTFLLAKKKNWLFISISLGLIGLIRSQDLILGMLILPFIKWKTLPQFLLGVVIGFIPQLIAWQLVNGNFWHSPYISSTEGFNFLHPQILSVLFSPQNGLFLWTPIVLLGFIGLWMRKRSFPLKLMGIVVCLQIFLVASWSIWWEGASYSGRMFVSILPLIGFGLANFFSIFNNPKLRFITLMYAITIPLSIINFFLIFFFLLTK